MCYVIVGQFGEECVVGIEVGIGQCQEDVCFVWYVCQELAVVYVWIKFDGDFWYGQV